MACSEISAVQILTPAERTAMILGEPDDGNALVYVGMPGNAARAYGIADAIVGPFGKPWACLNDPRGWAVAYREYLWKRIRADGDFALAVRDLHGKTLVCWCRAKGPNTRCHAEILLSAVEWLFHGIHGDEPEGPYSCDFCEYDRWPCPTHGPTS